MLPPGWRCRAVVEVALVQRHVRALRLDEGEDTSEICAVSGIEDEGHFEARVCGNGPTERCLRRQAPRSPKRDDQKRDEQRGDNGVRSAGGLSLPPHGDPPGQKTRSARISQPASLLTRAHAKEIAAATGGGRWTRESWGRKILRRRSHEGGLPFKGTAL